MGQVYTATLDEISNLTGNRIVTNSTGRLWVVKNVNVYYGGLSVGVFKLFGVGGNTALYAQLGTGFDQFAEFVDQRITIPDGDQLQYACSVGMDVGVYGFELSLP
jgi:hypothetical protein